MVWFGLVWFGFVSVWFGWVCITKLSYGKRNGVVFCFEYTRVDDVYDFSCVLMLLGWVIEDRG